MDSSADPVRRSVAEAGEVAEAPEKGQIKVFFAEDENGECIGMSIRWFTGAAWLWASESSYETLDDAR